MTRTGRPKSPIILTISWLLSCLYPCAQAQTPQHESVGQVVESVALINPLGDPIKVRRVDPEKHPIRIDGHLDEAIWSEPPDIDQLVVIDPDTLAPAPYKTSFRMFYTDAGLYASFDMEQPADTIVKRFTSRDDFDSNRDNVSFTLDTSGAGLYAYWMNLSLGDVQMDGTVKPERRFSREWDGAWYGATQTTEKGWSAEYFVPWSLMPMPKTDRVRRVGIFLSRKVAHLNERWAWPALPSSKPQFLSALQPLDFEGVDPRQQWSLFPYASATYDRVEEDMKYRAGVDVFWRPSTNFQLTATLNPDFGVVEADDAVFNLTADETFFPEKRLFFLEGQDIFNTSPRSEASSGLKMIVVNTRRIGSSPVPPEIPPDLPPDILIPQRELLRPADLLGATKVTGQFGRVRYGLLGAFEQDSKFVAGDRVLSQDGRSFGALRMLYEDDYNAAYRGLGFISTIVAHPDGDALVHGIDFHRLSTGGTWDINGQLLYSDSDDKGDGFGGLFDVDYTPRQGMKHTVQLSWYDDTIDINELGFQVRSNLTDGRYSLQWVKSDLEKIRDLNVQGFARYAVNGEGYKVNGGAGVDLSITLNNLHNILLDLSHFPKRFDDRNSFGNGTFEKTANTSGSVAYETDTAKPFSGWGRIHSSNESAGGRFTMIAGGFSWRPGHNLSLKFELQHLRSSAWLLHQEDRNFTTFISRGWTPKFSFDYFASARHHLRLVFQWVGIRAQENEFYELEEDGTNLIPVLKPPGPPDDFSLSELSFQLRYRWQIAPLSDLFVVYTKGDSLFTELLKFDDLFRRSWNSPLVDQLVVKLRYRFGS